MEIWHSVVYGFVQGVTEFLPVSSSGHLALLPRFLNIEDPGVSFDLMMHLGTTLALLVYFWRRIWHLSKKVHKIIPYNKSLSNAQNQDEDIFFLRNFTWSTFCSLVVVVLCKKLAIDYGRSEMLVAINLVVFGVLMFAADWWGKHPQEDQRLMYKGFGWKKAGLIGVAQACAIFPGVSRSGATLTICRAMGMSRQEATDYSFFLAIPIIFMGCFVKTIESLTLFVSEQTSLTSHNLLHEIFVAITGVLVSFAVGITTIHYFLKLISRIGLGYFALYRIVFACFLFYLFSL